jgi:hypothetical protein
VQVVADITGGGGLNFLRNIMICPVHMLVNKIWDSSVCFFEKLGTIIGEGARGWE